MILLTAKGVVLVTFHSKPCFKLSSCLVHSSDSNKRIKKKSRQSKTENLEVEDDRVGVAIAAIRGENYWMEDLPHPLLCPPTTHLTDK